MKKIVSMTLALLMAGGAFAESVPQPAFRLLDGYLEKRAVAAEYGAKVGPWVLMGTGLTAGAAAATVWFAGDALADSAGVKRMPRETRFGAALGLGVGAVILTGVGFVLHKVPPVYDERAQYSAIYHETDPVVQETLAVGRLESLAEMGRNTRIVTGWANLAVSGLGIGLRLADNHDRGRTWSHGFYEDWGWEATTILTSATSLLIKSEEEALWDEYKATVARLTRN